MSNQRYTKVYEVHIFDVLCFVREHAGMQPLFFIEYGQYGHLYHKEGFEWDNVLRENLGKEVSNDIRAKFQQCEEYLQKNPRPWEKDDTIKFHKEYWDRN